MCLIRKVIIRSFKSILNQSIDLGRINIFIGTNGAGKSNLLEAIGMISAATTGEIDYSALADRGVRLSSPEVFRSSFRNKERKMTFSIEAVYDSLSYKIDVISSGKSSEKNPWKFHAERVHGAVSTRKIAWRSNSIIGINGVLGFGRDRLKQYQSIISAAESLGAFDDEELEALHVLRDFAIYAPSTPILRGVAEDTSRKSPVGLYGGSLSAALEYLLTNERNKSLKNIKNFFSLLDWFESVGVSSPSEKLQSSHVHTGTRVVDFTEKYMKRNFKKLYAYDVSEGALYVLFVLIVLSHPGAPNVFALDNVDSALNPGLVTNLVAFISKYLVENPKKQVLMTSHNPTTLDAVDLFDQSHRLFVVKRGDFGDTRVERIMPPPGYTKVMWEKKYGHMKLSEIWLSGVIDGLTLPN